jgi:cytochrome c2
MHGLSRKQWLAGPALAALLVFLMAGSAERPAFAAWAERPSPIELPNIGGDPHRGARIIARLGCGGCHSIPGIAGARGLVGPPLDNIGDRTIIAGLLPNTPDNMIAWLKSPQSIVPGNAMPNMELDDNDARDIAAYLFRLR